MDYHALQQKLFEMDPTDPAEDIRKLTEMASGSEAPITESVVDGHGDVHDIPQGSAPIDKDYSIRDFAKLAGVQLNEATPSIVDKGAELVGKGAEKVTKKLPGSGTFSDAFKKGYKDYDKIGMHTLGKDADGEDPKDKDSKDKDDKNKKPGNKFLNKKKNISMNNKTASIEALEARISYLEEVIATLVEDKKKTKLMKARDPNAQYMNDLRKSGAAGSHKDKTKTIPRKQKYKDTNESIKSQLWAALNEKK